jgi:hypothetical protein
MAFLGAGRVLARRALTLLTVAAIPAYTQAPPVGEYQVKAAFLFNFAKFVGWPPQAFKSPDEPMGICVFGPNPFGSTLEEMVRGKLLGKRGFVVYRVSEPQRARTCHILFLNEPEGNRSRSLLDQLAGASILTVGEAEGFLANGGVVNFKLDDARVRIEISTEAADRAQLHISSKLLSLAHTRKR